MLRMWRALAVGIHIINMHFFVRKLLIYKFEFAYKEYRDFV